eukprot:945031-Prorocentrum_minimum.AAC.1
MCCVAVPESEPRVYRIRIERIFCRGNPQQARRPGHTFNPSFQAWAPPDGLRGLRVLRGGAWES